MRRLCRFVILFAAFLGLAAGASVEEPLPEARELLKLVRALEMGARPSVDEVVAAYKEYAHLYELQSDLAHKFDDGFKSAAGKLSFEDKYERIGRTLSEPGLELVAESLFAPFNGGEAPNERLAASARLRKSIEKAIDELGA